MRKSFHILLLHFLVAAVSIAQEKVTVSLKDRPISELIQAIEEQSSYQIYYQPEQIDTLNISVETSKSDPGFILKNALKRTSFKVSEFENKLFISHHHELVTRLPEGYLDVDQSIHTDSIGDTFQFTMNRREQKATSENKVYEIGTPTTRKYEFVTITGKLTDFKSGEPIPSIALFIKDLMTGTSTDEQGNYSIKLPVGRHEIIITGVGVKDTKRQILIHTEGELNIELEEEAYSLNEVLVSSERIQNIRNTSIGVERLQIKDIKNIPTAFGEADVLKALLSLPGVKAVGEISSGINVRGGATDQNLILFNNATIYNPTHLFGFFSVFNPDIVQDMELYKSSIPAKYGGRISSVLDINSREGNKEKFKGSASIGLLTSRLTIEGPLSNKKTSFLLAGRTTYSDWILKQLPEKSGYKDGSANFFDLNATINHKFSNYDNLSINGYYSKDKFHFNTEERYTYNNTNGSVRWNHIYNPKLIMAVTGGYDHYDYSTKNTTEPVKAYSLSFNIDQMYGKIDFTAYISHKHTLDFGANSIFYTLLPGKYSPNGVESLVLEKQMQKEKALESAIYLSDKWDITPELSINAGVRYSMYQALGPRIYYKYDNDYLPSITTINDTISGEGAYKTYHGPEFRLSARYEFQDGFSIKAGYNTMRQYIHKLSNTTIMSPTDTWKLSDMNIKPQTGSQFALGLYKNFVDNTIETSIEGYYKKMDNYLDYRNGAELILNEHIETDVLETEGRAYGIEFMIKKTTGKINGWVSYTYSRTELRQNDPMIADPVNDGGWYPADFDKPHDIKFVGNYRFNRRFSISLNCDYSTGRPITLPVSKYNFGGGEFVYFSDRNKYRIPDFFRMDASFNIEPSHRLTLLTHSTISFGVYNLTGRKNAYSVYYISEGGRLKGYQLAIFGMPIPYVSYNIKF